MIKFLIEKELKQMLRNKGLPGMLLGMPIMMMLLLPWAANQEVSNIRLSVIDQDHSTHSERLIEQISASKYFKISESVSSNQQALQSIEKDQSDIIFEIQDHFEEDLIKHGAAKVMISANAVNSTKGGLGTAYLGTIINNFATQMRSELSPTKGLSAAPMINVVVQNRFNTHLNYQVFMAPALIVMLLTMLCGFMMSLNIVAEKEFGTIEQINVTPVSRFTFILAKLLPYWLVGLIVMSISLTIALIIYNLHPAGSLLTIYFFAALYILSISGLGLIVSNYSDTMQQAMFVMYFFIMILNLMSGLFTPISSMPHWAQNITILNPLRYFTDVMRMVYLKGSSLKDLSTQFIALGSFAVGLNLWAVLSYRKRN